MTPDPADVQRLLATRSSPAAFDAAHIVTEDDVAAILEAARTAPSAGNSQPWAFIVARRGDETHARIVAHLAGSSARWAPDASVLIGNVTHRFVEDTNWEYSEFSLYDLGQAVALMTLQAHARGLSARQFRAFDQPGLHAEFEIPDHWQLATITAFGLAAPATEVQAAARTRSNAARERRGRDELLWPPPNI